MSSVAFRLSAICPPVLFVLQLLMFHIPQEIWRCHFRQLTKSTREFTCGPVFSYNDTLKTQSADSGVMITHLVMVMHLYTAFSIHIYIQMWFTSAYVHWRPHPTHPTHEIMKQHKDQTSTPGTPCPTLCD